MVLEAVFGIDVQLAVCTVNNDHKASHVVLLFRLFSLFQLTTNNDCLKAAGFSFHFN